METIINSQRGQISSPILGPMLQLDPSQLGFYQKGQESELSLPSDASQNILENKSQQLDYLKNGFLAKASKSFSRRQPQQQIVTVQNKQQNQRHTDSYSQKKYEAPSILKNLLKNSLVAKFKHTIFQHSYVLQNSMKSLLLQESYLIEDVSKKKIKTQEEQNNFCILRPGDKKILIWDQISLFMNILCLWLCPILFAFNEISFLKNQLQIWIIAYLFLDILINLNRATIDQGEIISDRRIIMFQYARKHMFKNLLSSLLWLLCYYEFYKIEIANEIIFVTQIILLLYQTQNNYQKFNESLYLRDSASSIKDIISLIILIYLFAHYMACFWHYIGVQMESIGTSWIIEKNLKDANVYIRYNYSFYWAAMTMVTVGYGDITPQNYIEMAYANIIMLISSVMYAYTLNSIGIILKSYNDQRQKQTRSLVLINSYMRKNNIDETIQTRVRNCIKYQIEKEFNENFENVYQIINDLPNGLQNELNRDLQIKVIRNIKILNQQFSASTMKNLVNQFKFCKFTPNDFLFRRGEIGDPYLYYIEEGEVQLIEENSKKVLATIQKGQTVGEYQFFSGLQPKCSAISSGFTSIYQLKRTDFINLIRYNQKDYEKFHNIKDTIIFNKSFSILLHHCNICKRFNHLTIECPLLTYQPDLEQRIKKQLFDGNQSRNQKFERTNEKLNVRSMYKEIQGSIKSFQKQTDYIVQVDGSSIRIDSPGQIKVSHSQDGKKKKTIQPKIEKINLDDIEYNDKQYQPQEIMIHSGKRRKTMAQTLAAFNKDLQKKTSIKQNLNTYEILHDYSSNALRVEYENEDILQEFKMDLQFHNIELDKIQQYQFYKQHNNAEIVVRNHDHQRKRRNTQFILKRTSISKYTFNLNLLNKVAKYKQTQKRISQFQI